MATKLLKQMRQRGYAVRAVPVEHVEELREGIEAPKREGMIAEELHKEYLRRFTFSPPGDLKNARSLIVAAMRQPQFHYTFTFNGEPIRVTVPGIYLHPGENDEKVRESLAGVLAPEGYQVVPAVLPNKLLAVRSGLASYGRNNITYVDGMGSFHRLTAFFSDMPPGRDTWREVKALERCDDCGACGRKCPTGAIAPERFLLHAERCIVFHNEQPGEVPFPQWMDPSWHNCLVGCMLCQMVCPENKPYLKQVEEGPTFSEEETMLILSGAKKDQLPLGLAGKLEECDLLGMLDVLPRNLNALLKR